MKYMTAAAAIALSGFASAAGAAGIDLAAMGLSRDADAFLSYADNETTTAFGGGFFSLDLSDFETFFSGFAPFAATDFSLTLTGTGYIGAGIEFADLGNGVEVLAEDDTGLKYLVIAMLSDATGDFLGLADGAADTTPLASLEIYGVSAVSEVPLPATLPLLVAAIAGLGFTRRRRGC